MGLEKLIFGKKGENGKGLETGILYNTVILYSFLKGTESQSIVLSQVYLLIRVL